MIFRVHRRSGALDPCHRGFTLVELLTVIAIIGVLVALLLPAVQAARESARRLQCRNNIKQLALAALSHESAVACFPTGGWNKKWLGHPDRGFGKSQPGGWIYNILPFLEQQSLHDLGTTNGSMTIEDANAIRVTTPLAMFNCPSRRPSTLFDLGLTLTFNLTNDTFTSLARSDYAMSAGDYVQLHAASPVSLAAGDAPGFKWSNMTRQTGISHQRSQVTVNNIKDGTSNTFLIGEKYINRNHYTNGKNMGDMATMYCGGDSEVLRWTGVVGGVGTIAKNNRPRQDMPTLSDVNDMQWFGSVHVGAFNISFCDGSVRAIEYAINDEVFRRLGNRMDGSAIDTSQF